MSVDPCQDHNYGQRLSLPPHVQRVEKALNLEPFLDYVEAVVSHPVTPSVSGSSSEEELDLLAPTYKDWEGNKIFNGIAISKAERKADKTRLYNFTKVKKSRKWLKNVLMSDSSSDEEDERPIRDEDVQEMLKIHQSTRLFQMQYYQNPEYRKYQYYSTGLLSVYDKFPEHYKLIAGPKKKISKDSKKFDKKIKAKLKKMKRAKDAIAVDAETGEVVDPKVLEEMIKQQTRMNYKDKKLKKLTPEQADNRRRKIWVHIVKKDIPKAYKQKLSARKETLALLKKLSHQCMRECRRSAIQSQKVMKETTSRARRLTREMLIYWKRFEKVEKEHRRKAEKEAQEQRKIDLELREARRQELKLNFLITQTELYAHFMARKLTGETDAHRDRILHKLGGDPVTATSQHEVNGRFLVDVAADDYDIDTMKNRALKNAEDAFNIDQSKRQVFDQSTGQTDWASCLHGADQLSLANPAMSTEVEAPQPTIFEGKLKGYQLKGMNWLINLYNQCINGILADEMGLGKTVQSIAFFAHLAETQGTWGPFLIIAPASTLHNWQQECSRFVPKLKAVPYWGNTQDRRILRKFWDQKCLHTEEASFHAVITSYQLVIQDVKYFQRIKWQYMILDEAQAIKSSSSVRWKTLLGFNCRNRLLLTGTPIQNSMAELWALLHFIMPTLFDSHDEFNEWFSKDIESHAEKQSGIDENQLSRLHLILKPFMLRRVKRDVENELSDKIEILVYCPLTTRQRLLYQAIKKKISIEDLVHSTASNTSYAQNTTSSLMNLVMQFRKVCNHPELFERREERSPFYMNRLPYYMPKLIYREGLLDRTIPSRERLLYNKLYIFNPSNIHESLNHSGCNVHSCFSFTRFIDMSPAELSSHMLSGLIVRWLSVFLWLKSAYRIQHYNEWATEAMKSSKYLSCRAFLLEPCQTTSFASLDTSPQLRNLVFVKPTRAACAHIRAKMHFMQETTWHRNVRLKHARLAAVAHLKKNPLSPPHSPTKHHPSLDPEVLAPPHAHKYRSPVLMSSQLTELPAYLYYSIPKVEASCVSCYTLDRSAIWQRLRESLCGTPMAQQSLLYGTPDIFSNACYARYYFTPVSISGLLGSKPKHGWSNIFSPDKETLITDAGKLYVLDSLLGRLKRDGHRVLIYSQMTRMIDLLEEYMWHRKHTYMRLDGSSKISDRRDMVADFQNRSDIFVFLLSTRAGGLGINLTAADTVIFYDSDWNPTVDQQAMDRAHRLGQTKQVTVYRLVCKGTIEERILQRAKEKSEIQRMVISGGNFRPDILKPKEVVSLLIDDDDMENKIRVHQEEKGDKNDQYKSKEKKRKRDKNPDKSKNPPGRKKVKVEEQNMTIAAAPDNESVASFDSLSVPASPLSEVSVGSELAQQYGLLNEDDSSNDALVIVDDAHSTFPTATSTPVSGKRGRGRGRPRGSGVGRRPRGRGSAKKALSAAEIAGAQAGMTAAYAAYGYNLAGRGGASSSSGTPTGTPRTGSPALSRS